MWLALTEVVLLNTSLLLALLPASLHPLKHSIAWNLACNGQYRQTPRTHCLAAEHFGAACNFCTSRRPSTACAGIPVLPSTRQGLTSSSYNSAIQAPYTGACRQTMQSADKRGKVCEQTLTREPPLLSRRCPLGSVLTSSGAVVAGWAGLTVKDPDSGCCRPLTLTVMVPCGPEQQLPVLSAPS